MAKVYDPIMCMMVEQRTNDAARAYSVGYKSNGVFQSIGVMANSESEAVAKAKKYFESKKKDVEIFGASIGESLETMKMKGKPVLDSRTCDAPLSEEKVIGYKFDQITRRLNNIEYHYNEAKKGLISDLNSVKKDINEFSSKYGDDASTSELNKRHGEVMRIVSSMR